MPLLGNSPREIKIMFSQKPVCEYSSIFTYLCIGAKLLDIGLMKSNLSGVNLSLFFSCFGNNTMHTDHFTVQLEVVFYHLNKM